jgi:hypothetical protein
MQREDGCGSVGDNARRCAVKKKPAKKTKIQRPAGGKEGRERKKRDQVDDAYQPTFVMARSEPAS